LAGHSLPLLVHVNGGVETLSIAELYQLEKFQIRVELLRDHGNFDARVHRIKPRLSDLGGNHDRESLLVEPHGLGIELGALMLSRSASKQINFIRDGQGTGCLLGFHFAEGEEVLAYDVVPT